jgi:adenylate kinase|tara:strand:- start:13823 stop:14503 length:681 start_codon:yes stop_codon:yes gene_type:complete
MVNLIFLGPPGSGKGTQAKIISNKMSLPIISTGDILREEIIKKSDVGLKAAVFVDSGKLVPDEVVISMIERRISTSDYSDGFIMDGFPRNSIQAEKLDHMLVAIGKKIDSVLELKIDSEILVQRMVARFTCGNCGEIYNKLFKKTKKDNICDICNSSDFVYRKDDNEQVVRSRQQVYNDTSEDLVEFYLTKGLIYKLDASKSSGFITEKILNYFLKIDLVNDNNNN